MRAIGLGLATLALVVAGCRDTPPTPESARTRSPNAQPDIVAALREDLVAERHPSDGGGRAWLETERGEARAGGPGTWTLVYEAGPHGIAVGGMLLLQVSPFWGWSTPQVDAEDAPGYTTVSTDAEGVTPRGEDAGPAAPGRSHRGSASRERGADPDRLRRRPARRPGRHLRRAGLPLLDVGRRRRGRHPRAPARLAGRRRRPRSAGAAGAHRAERRAAGRDGPPERRGPRRGGQRLACSRRATRRSDRHGRRGASAARRSAWPPGTAGTPSWTMPTARRGDRARRGAGSRRAAGSRQPPGRVRDPAAGVLGRPSRPLGPVGRDGNARGLLPLRPGHRGPRRRRAHRPRPLGHAAALRSTPSSGRGSASRCRPSTSRAASSPSSATSGRAGSTATATSSTSRTRVGS